MLEYQPIKKHLRDGLGWALNPGAITRQVRGLPDEFKGDVISTLKKMKPNRTYGVGAGVGAELVGGDPSLASLGLTGLYNNYNGISYSIDGAIGYPFVSNTNINSTLSLGFSLNTNEGLGLRPSFDLREKDGSENESISTGSIGLGYHSRYGLQDLSFGLSKSKRETIAKTSHYRNTFSPLNQSYSASISLASSGFTPTITSPMIHTNFAFKLSAGGAFFGVFPKGFLNGFYNKQDFKDHYQELKGFGYQYLQEAEEGDLLDYNRERDGIIHKEAPNLPLSTLTHDIYSVTGQGVGAMFKSLRNDIGVKVRQQLFLQI